MPALPRRPRDDRLGHPASGRRAELDPVGPLQDRAARAHPSRDCRDARRTTPRPRRTRRRAAWTGSRSAPGSATCRPSSSRATDPHRPVRRELREPVPVMREVLEAMREGFGPGRTIGCRLTDESTSAVGTDPEDVFAAAAAVGADGLADHQPHARLVADLPWLDVDRAAVAGGQERRRGVRAGRESADAASAYCHRAGARSRRCRSPDRRRRLRRGRDDPSSDRRPQLRGGRGPASPSRAASAAIRGASATTTRPPDRLHRQPVAGTSAPSRPRLRPTGLGPLSGRRRAGGVRGRRIGRRVRAPGRGLRARDRPGRPDAARARRPGARRVARGPRDPGGWLAAVDVRYGAEASSEDVLAERPDQVVVATGADAYIPAIGGDGLGVVDAWDPSPGLRSATAWR